VQYARLRLRMWWRCSKLFWVDLVALLPFDYFVVWMAARHGGDMSDTALNYFQLFRLLRMVGGLPGTVPVCVV
jgi:hypothetical protein